MLKILAASAALAALLVAAPAAAGTILDTGTPTEIGGGYSLISIQWLAGEFTLTGDTTITGIEAYLGGFTPGSHVTFRVLNDNNATNAPGTSLFSTVVTTGAEGGGAWEVANGLNWQLGAGVYWAAFETTDSGYMPRGAPNPTHEARSPGAGGGAYFDSAPLTIGVRVEGDAGFGPSPVPEPASWAMLIGGFGMAGAMLRRRRDLTA